MLSIPSLVLYTNKINFSENPRAGIESLLTEIGYDQADDLISTLGEIFDNHSVYALIDLYRVIGSDGIALTSVLFNNCLGVLNTDITIPKLKTRRPRFTNGGDYIESQLKASTYKNYSSFLTWLDYTYIDILDFIQDPLLYAHWISTQDPQMVPINQFILTGKLTSFFRQLILSSVGLDLLAYPSIWSTFTHWVNIAFTKYAFGASINQSEWHL